MRKDSDFDIRVKVHPSIHNRLHSAGLANAVSHSTLWTIYAETFGGLVCTHFLPPIRKTSERPKTHNLPNAFYEKPIL